MSILWGTLQTVTAVQNIPGYTLKTTLGSGGMAKVYLAVQHSLDRQVAIKILSGELINDPVVKTQFEQESRLVAGLNHPNIVQVIDTGKTPAGNPYFVMPYVKSVSLAAVLKRSDVASTRKLDIAIQICKALAYAHRNGIVHRDIKPANVLVDYDGHVRLVDFGIAGYFVGGHQHTHQVVMGTDGYMAPEQLEGVKTATALSDIYSLGLVLHQLFLGGLPHQITADTQQARDPIGLQLEPLIHQCISPSPAQRPASAEDLCQKLLLIAQGRHLRKQWQNDTSDLPANYKILDVLKENPFGATYLACADSANTQRRFLVVKKQKLEHVGNAQLINSRLTQIKHPHLARVYGTGKNERVFITVSEFLGAGSLQERLTQSLNLGQWVQIAQQLCSALACAHSHGIIHGNLRPSNILFAENHFIKVTDFGFPPHSYGDQDNWYRQPTEELSTSADIYAAGVILFQLLSDQRPQKSLFDWRNYWMLRHVPRKLRTIIIKMSQPQQAKRFTAEQAMLALQAYYDQQDTRIAKKIFIQRKTTS
jgi:eukaryotic-like serine/threonine-protein kinase